MRESVIYQEIEAQAEEKGLAKGRKQEARLIALNLLNEGMSVDLIARVTSLTVEQVQHLQQN
ncbi:MAG: hypothetical protein KME64_10215 [Scytonematopsis contorta HA4267-MV1]|jgi:predicted transposase/invertase (TIGR01784 family)|nr:hypothetical protein [Scytonematopsis contorta HA4267-MV1]